MSEHDLSDAPGLQATMAVHFVERDEKVYVIFEAALGSMVIEVGVFEAGEADGPLEGEG